MEENENREVKQKDIKTLLKLRSKLDAELEKKYLREIVVMFSDICESTVFFESRGDLEGRQMVMEHNNLLFPVIEENNGKIVKTIGDSVMASFEKPEDAVKSSIKIQQKLFDFNQNRAFNKQVHIRIGINQGKNFLYSYWGAID